MHRGSLDILDLIRIMTSARTLVVNVMEIRGRLLSAVFHNRRLKFIGGSGNRGKFSLYPLGAGRPPVYSRLLGVFERIGRQSHTVGQNCLEHSFKRIPAFYRLSHSRLHTTDRRHRYQRSISVHGGSLIWRVKRRCWKVSLPSIARALGCQPRLLLPE
jgi:hypothetical protein